jgi:hypothetical protein
MKHARGLTHFSILAFATALSATSAHADALLTGAVTSATGAAMAGVAVSAKSDALPITTTVFTDLAGRYVFPPLANGKYHLWAQAIAYEAGRGDVDLTAARQQDFKLNPTRDFVRQLQGDEFLAALPEVSADDARMKTMVRKTCTARADPSRRR